MSPVSGAPAAPCNWAMRIARGSRVSRPRDARRRPSPALLLRHRGLRARGGVMSLKRLDLLPLSDSARPVGREVDRVSPDRRAAAAVVERGCRGCRRERSSLGSMASIADARRRCRPERPSARRSTAGRGCASQRAIYGRGGVAREATHCRTSARVAPGRYQTRHGCTSTRWARADAERGRDHGQYALGRQHWLKSRNFRCASEHVARRSRASEEARSAASIVAELACPRGPHELVTDSAAPARRAPAGGEPVAAVAATARRASGDWILARVHGVPLGRETRRKSAARAAGHGPPHRCSRATRADPLLEHLSSWPRRQRCSAGLQPREHHRTLEHRPSPDFRAVEEQVVAVEVDPAARRCGL